MTELTHVLQEVLRALGVDGVERIGLTRGTEPGDHHSRPAEVEAAGG